MDRCLQRYRRWFSPVSLRPRRAASHPAKHRSLSAALLIAAVSLVPAAPGARAQSTWIVNTLSDSSDASGSCSAGTCSLRDAIAQSASGDTITFAVAGTIVLSPALGPFSVYRNLTIAGPGALQLTLSGGNAGAVFTVASAAVNLSGLTIAGGSAANGAAIANSGVLSINAVAFSGNSATQQGAAIFNTNTGNLTVAGSTFSANSAAAGAAIANAGTAAITNSTFSANTASGTAGGAIVNTGTLVIAAGTFSANAAPAAAAIGNAASLTITNSILAGDSGGECNDLSGGACPVNGADGNLVGASGVNLLPLAYYGGPTQTMLPLPGSIAICAGTASSATTDQRGFPVNASCVDAGAVQTNYQLVANTSDSGPGSLRDALVNANAAAAADIALAVTGTIDLASAPPAVTGQVNVIGPGAASLAISALYTHGFTINAGAELALYGLTLSGGSESLGGALNNNGGIATLTHCVLSGNSASAGGAITNSSGLLFVNSSNFQANTSDGGGAGGAIYNDDGNATINGSTFTGNSATRGGAIFNFGGVLSIVNSTFSGNSAPNGYGGALLNGNGLVSLTSTTVSANAASLGSGIWNGGTLALTNTIVAGNLTNDVAGDDCDGCGTQPVPNLIGTPSAIVDPQLSALQANGAASAIQTMIPLPGSPAICAGAASPALAAITADQRGFPRFNTTYTGYSAASPCNDLGAVQTNYTSLAFIQQPTNTQLNAAITPAPTLAVLETNPNVASPNNTDAVNGVAVPLTFSGGAAEIHGALTETTAAGVAAFGNLVPTVPGGGFTLSATIPILPGTTLSATSSPFDVDQTPSISSVNSLEAEVGLPVSFTVATTGYPAPALTTTGTLPPGLAFIDKGNGTATLSGIPTTPATDSFTIDAKSGATLDTTQLFTVTTVPALTLSPTSLPAGTYGTRYTATMAAAGGVAPYTLSESGALPPGLSWNAGSLTGTPTAAGSFGFTISAQDSLGAPAIQSYSLVIAKATPVLAWVPSSTIGYGTTLAAVLNAAAAFTSAPLAGAFSYTAQTPGGTAVPVTAATLLLPGSYTLAVTFTPANTTDFNTAGATAPLTVTTAGLTVMANNAARPYGTANPPFAGSVTGALNGDIFTESFATPANTTSNTGNYPIVPSVTGAALADYAIVIQNGTLTVTKAASTTTLKASAASIAPGQSVTLTAHVASSTTGMPTGTVSFYDGSAWLGTATLSSGAASWSTTSLSGGTSPSLTAVYSGDTNFTASTASAITIVVAAPDFTIASTGATVQTMPPGSHPKYQFTVTPLDGSYAAPVAFGASGLPAGATAAFSPSSIPVGGGTQTVTMTVALPLDDAAAYTRPVRRLPVAAFALLLLPLAGTRRMRRRGRALARLLCLCVLTLGGLAAVGGLAGCGVQSGKSWPSEQTYTITVTASTGSLQHTAAVTLNEE